MTEIPTLQINPDTGISNLTETDFVRMSATSGTPWKHVFRDIQIPEAVSGLRILDIGAGTSDAVAKLLSLGADAYALDPVYHYVHHHDPKMLQDSVRKNFVGKLRNYPDLFKEAAGALSRFSRSINENPDRYIDGFASQMAFPDNYFDIVYSATAILIYQDIDMNILRSIVEECLRVTKPGGSIRLYPFMEISESHEQTVNSARLRNNYKLVEEMTKNPRVVRIQRLDFSTPIQQAITLVIHKAT